MPKIAKIIVKEAIVEVPNRYSPILKQTSFNIYDEDFIVILGHNGSGKSTLLKILNGELQPTKGQVLYQQTPVNKINNADKAKIMLTLTQKTEDRLFNELSLEENILIWESRFPKIEQLNPKQLFEKFNLTITFSQMLKNPVADLSGGEKQKLLMALMIAHPPQILFLDEHTSALDPKAREEIMLATNLAIAENKITAVMVTHSLEDAIKHGNRLIILNEGIIVFDQQKTKLYSERELKLLMEGAISTY